MRYEPIAFSEIEGWSATDHALALTAFCVSSAALAACTPQRQGASAPLGSALTLLGEVASRSSALNDPRSFFERHFLPHRVCNNSIHGLVTGYFEPEYPASRSASSEYPVPIHSRPASLVNVVSEIDRANDAQPQGRGYTHLQRTPDGLVPMPDRKAIDQGGLAADAPVIFYVRDIVDRFVMQVQGSARLRLPDGSAVRITYDGKNGYPYTSIGRLLIDRGYLGADEVTLDRLVDWLKADLERAREIIWANQSYVFFRELARTDGPQGVLDCSLTPGYSLAVDPSYHQLGLPIFVEAPELRHVPDCIPFRRLMIAQDVGSAIKGPERGDIFIGGGAAAGSIAGAIKHSAAFTVLFPSMIPPQPASRP